MVILQKRVTMKLLKVIPKVFYEDIKQGHRLFIDCLGFRTLYEDGTLWVLDRDGVTISLVKDAEFAAKDRPELRLATDDIETLYAEVVAKDKALLHPNSDRVKLQPWGLKEFALRDESDVCVIVQQSV